MEANRNESHHHPEEAVKLFFRCMIPVALLIGGIVILALRIAGWSLIVGLPLTIFGVVFLIYSYDEVVVKTIKPYPEVINICTICGKPTPLFYGQDPNKLICPKCESKKDVKNRAAG